MVGPQTVVENPQGILQQWHRLGQTVRGLEQSRQIVEADGDLRVIVPVAEGDVFVSGHTHNRRN
jgi:hypothetical protein